MRASVGLLLIGFGWQGVTTFRLVGEPDCGAKCRLSTKRLFRIGSDSEDVINNYPIFISSERKGRIFLIGPRPRHVLPEGPPLVFDQRGQYLGTLGGRGSGPGETWRPSWVDVDTDDSIRVFEQGRMVVFGQDLKHVATRSDTRSVRRLQDVVMLPDRSIVALGSEFLTPGRPRAIHMLRPGEAAVQFMPEPQQPKADGRARVLARFRNRGSDRFWVAQFDAHEGHGYDLLLMDVSPRVHIALRRRPTWWRSAAIYGKPEFTPTSRVMAVREVANGIVGVLFAHPRADWRPSRIEPKRGSYMAYETRLELMDTARGVVVASAQMRGYPLRILSDSTFATYLEDEDGTPHIDVWSFKRQ